MTSTYHSISSISSATSSLGAASLTSPPRSVKKMRIHRNDSSSGALKIADDIKFDASFSYHSCANMEQMPSKEESILPLPPLPPSSIDENRRTNTNYSRDYLAGQRYTLSDTQPYQSTNNINKHQPQETLYHHKPAAQNSTSYPSSSKPIRMIDANGCVVKRLPTSEDHGCPIPSNYMYPYHHSYYNSYPNTFHPHRSHHSYHAYPNPWNTPSPERQTQNPYENYSDSNGSIYKREQYSNHPPMIAPHEDHNEKRSRKNANVSSQPQPGHVNEVDVEPTVTLLLAMPQDVDCLSDRQCFVRSELVEVFCATNTDVSVRHSKGAQKLSVGQVGIRCRFCHCLPIKDRAERAVCFPSTLSRIYQTVADMQRFHFESCSMVPSEVREMYKRLKTTRPRGMGSPQNYWIVSAKRAGLIDSLSSGIRLGQNSSSTPERATPLNGLGLSSPSTSKVDFSQKIKKLSKKCSGKELQCGDDRDDANILLMLKSTPRIDFTSTPTFNGDMVHI